MEKPRILLKTVPATELQLPISSTLESGMNRCFHTLKRPVIEIIYSEAALTGKPVFCIVDDMIAAKTKPSSRALHPIEDAYFHQSHLKGKQDYGHQAVSVMLSCNGIVLNYAFVLYNKAISKIDIVSELAAELSVTHKNFDLVTVKGRNSSLTPTMSTLPA